MSNFANQQVKPTIGIITALEKEYAAVKAVLENQQEYSFPGTGAGRRYLLGEVPACNGGKHTVVLALADMGNNQAATRATLLSTHFPEINSIIMVGIAGGIPYPEKPDEHVRLGDVVVSNQKGVVQYDFVKEATHGTEYRYSPRPPSAELVEAVRLLGAAEIKGERPWLKFIDQALLPKGEKRPSAKTDILHSSGEPEKTISHPKDPKRKRGQPRVFLGTIASANTLLKEPIKRDALRNTFGVKAVEMEASGIADATWNRDDMGYLVVRGICDYCDSYKNDTWQSYAAAVAAAYTRALLESIPCYNESEQKSGNKEPDKQGNPPLEEQIDPAYKPIIEAFKSGTVVPFLGAGINLCDRLSIPIPIPNGKFSQEPLSEIELALWLSQEIKKLHQQSNVNNSTQMIEELMGIPCLFCHVDITNRPEQCPILVKIEQGSGRGNNEVLNCPLAIQQRLDVAKMNIRFLSQHYEIHTSIYDLYHKVKQLFKDVKPNRLHRFFAELPEKMKKAGHGLPYRLIVTTNYDNLLEKAFCEAKQEFDVVFYVVEDNQPGQFKHRKFRSKIQEGKESIVPQETNFIEDPNQYSELFSRDYPYPVILKMYGSLEDGDFVITEDQHFSYLLNNNFEKIIPIGLLNCLKRSSLLFLGYSLNDYDLQLTLHKSWVQQTLFVGQKSSWFIHRSQPGSHEEKFWKDRHVTLYEIRLEDFLTQLERGVKQEMMQHA